MINSNALFFGTLLAQNVKLLTLRCSTPSCLEGQWRVLTLRSSVQPLRKAKTYVYWDICGNLEYNWDWCIEMAHLQLGMSPILHQFMLSSEFPATSSVLLTLTLGILTRRWPVTRDRCTVDRSGWTSSDSAIWKTCEKVGRDGQLRLLRDHSSVINEVNTAGKLMQGKNVNFQDGTRLIS